MALHEKSDSKGHVRVSVDDEAKTFSMRIWSHSPLTASEHEDGEFEIKGSVDGRIEIEGKKSEPESIDNISGSPEAIRLFAENIFSQHMVAGAREDFGGVQGNTDSTFMRARLLETAFKLLTNILNEQGNPLAASWDAVAYAFEETLTSIKVNEPKNKSLNPMNHDFKDALLAKGMSEGPSNVPLQLPAFIEAVHKDFDYALEQAQKAVAAGQDLEELRKKRSRGGGAFLT